MRVTLRSKKRARDDEVTSSDSDSDSDSDHGNERGRTVLAAVRKAIENGVKIPLEWNAAKVPCGDHRTTFGTYIGIVARERVNINYEKWTDLPAELLNEVYNEIAKGFTVLPERRGWMLSRASERWRSFKSRLARKYLYKKSGKLRKKAPSKYPFILQNDWEKFTTYCTSDKFKEKSEKNRARGKMNTSKYRGGRQGYQHFDEEIAKEFEAQGIQIDKVPRHLIWLKAHKNKDGSYAPGDLEIAEAIKTLEAQAQKGEISSKGRDDILAKVMKKPEHGGRVRAVGSGISNKEYFGFAERPKFSQMLDEVQGLRSELAQMASVQKSTISFLMEWSQENPAQFSPEQRQKISQLMAAGAGLGLGQSSGVDGQVGVGGLGGQSGDVSQFVGTGQYETGCQNANLHKSLVSFEPEAYHYPETEIGYIPDTEVDHVSEPETDDDFEPETGPSTPINCDQASPEHFVGAPPRYSTSDVSKVRNSWIQYVFQHKQEGDDDENVDVDVDA